MAKQHHYAVAVEWTGNEGTGTSHYRAFGRAHEIRAEGRPPIAASSDPAFRGDPARWNPEDLLVASLSGCHMLWYLHLAAVAGIIVTRYLDRAEGVMNEGGAEGGRFESVVLKPEIAVKRGADLAEAARLHHDAHAKCFIANSVNFPVTVEPRFVEEA